jgi:hypothetical protein
VRCCVATNFITARCAFRAKRFFLYRTNCPIQKKTTKVKTLVVIAIHFLRNIFIIYKSEVFSSINLASCISTNYVLHLTYEFVGNFKRVIQIRISDLSFWMLFLYTFSKNTQSFVCCVVSPSIWWLLFPSISSMIFLSDRMLYTIYTGIKIWWKGRSCRTPLPNHIHIELLATLTLLRYTHDFSRLNPRLLHANAFPYDQTTNCWIVASKVSSCLNLLEATVAV